MRQLYINTDIDAHTSPWGVSLIFNLLRNLNKICCCASYLLRPQLSLRELTLNPSPVNLQITQDDFDFRCSTVSIFLGVAANMTTLRGQVLSGTELARYVIFLQLNYCNILPVFVGT